MCCMAARNGLAAASASRCDAGPPVRPLQTPGARRTSTICITASRDAAGARQSAKAQCPRQHIHAAALPRVHQPQRLEARNGLAHHRAADLELLRQSRPRWVAFAQPDAARANLGPSALATWSESLALGLTAEKGEDMEWVGGRGGVNALPGGAGRRWAQWTLPKGAVSEGFAGCALSTSALGRSRPAWPGPPALQPAAVVQAGLVLHSAAFCWACGRRLGAFGLQLGHAFADLRHHGQAAFSPSTMALARWLKSAAPMSSTCGRMTTSARASSA